MRKRIAMKLLPFLQNHFTLQAHRARSLGSHSPLWMWCHHHRPCAQYDPMDLASLSALILSWKKKHRGGVWLPKVCTDYVCQLTHAQSPLQSPEFFFRRSFVEAYFPRFPRSWPQCDALELEKWVNYWFVCWFFRGNDLRLKHHGYIIWLLDVIS